MYRKQPLERRDDIKMIAGSIGSVLLEEAAKATAEIHEPRVQLHACVVPGPQNRTPEAAVMRELAISGESLSAQQLYELLDESVRPSVGRLRAFLRANDRTLVYQERQGGFVLGRRYQLRPPPRPVAGDPPERLPVSRAVTGSSVHHWRVHMLTREDIDMVGPIDPKLAALWSDVQLLADSVHLRTGADRDLAWHHLLLAVGNYKAQAPLFVLAFPSTSEPRIARREQTLTMRASDKLLEVSVEAPSTWRELMALIRGLGIPRTTTVLSALWPGQHVIMDWRALSAALALSGARLGWDQSLVDPTSTTRAAMSWASYDWYLRMVAGCADQVGKSQSTLNGRCGT